MYHQIQGDKAKYVKRYFQIDTINGKLMYAEKESQVENPSYETSFGSIVAVRKNIVSMYNGGERDRSGSASRQRKEQLSQLKQVATTSSEEYDKGPDGYEKVFEIQLTDRLFTLYSDDQEMVDKFVHYIE